MKSVHLNLDLCTFEFFDYITSYFALFFIFAFCRILDDNFQYIISKKAVVRIDVKSISGIYDSLKENFSRALPYKDVNNLMINIPQWFDFIIILSYLSIIYVAYYHSRKKSFFKIILKILWLHPFLVILLVAMFGGTGYLLKEEKYLTVIGTFYAILPIFYTVYLLKYKVFKVSKTNKFSVSKKSENDNNRFVFNTNKGRIYLENPYRGIYVQGGAGSGKSASVFEPIIQQIGEKNFAGILYDFKSPELTHKIFCSYKNSIVVVKNIDFKNPLMSDRVNPIDPKYLLKSAIAVEYTNAIINNILPETIKKSDFWSKNSKMILAGVIWFLRNEHPQYCTLPHAISLILHTPIDVLIKKISQDFEAGGMVASLRESIDRGAERTVAGILSTLQNGLSILNTFDIFWLLSKSDVDLHLNNPDNPTFLCIGNDSTLPTTYTPAISLIITVALRQMNQPNQQKAVVLLDEAPTIFIPNIEQIPATARSNKIATIFGVQDYAQLADKYGEEKAQVIISNLGNQFFGRITNGKTAQMVQNLFSKTNQVFISKSKGTGTSGKMIHFGSSTNEGTSENIQERNRVKISDLVNLSQGEFYGIIAEGTPREFLKTQFIRDVSTDNYVNQKIPINSKMLEENYLMIVQQAKSIIN